MKKNIDNEIKITAHSKYRCQYHIVFAPKYQRQVIYGKIKKDVGEIMNTYNKSEPLKVGQL